MDATIPFRPMSSANNTMPPTQSSTIVINPSSSTWKPLLFWTSAISALLLALSLHLLSRNTLSPTLIHRLLPLLSPPKSPLTSTRPPCVRWMAPFLSGGGYSSEAWSYITALQTTTTNPSINLNIQQHGDQFSPSFWAGLPEESKLLAYKLYAADCLIEDAIVVCHSEPGAWHPPLFDTLPCPSTGYGRPRFVIGRTMFETDRLNPEHVRRCNRMDAVWVPTEFHVSTFIQSGVDPSKVVKMVQPVDVEFFDPAKHNALIPRTGVPVLGPATAASSAFVFLSVFKWEHRKGWDVLLKSYLQEFSESDKVALFLLTNAYHSDSDFSSKIIGFIEECGIEEPKDGWAVVHVIDIHVPQTALPGIYKAANVFVLPSRGEGWGRPIVEAMAMALPVIATNWSGPTEYLTEENGYPLALDRMSEVVEGPFKGHLWAEPSSHQLRLLMRHVVNNPEEGREKGRRAREDMIEKFSPEVVARLVMEQFQKILKNHTGSEK